MKRRAFIGSAVLVALAAGVAGAVTMLNTPSGAKGAGCCGSCESGCACCEGGACVCEACGCECAGGGCEGCCGDSCADTKAPCGAEDSAASADPKGCCG